MCENQPYALDDTDYAVPVYDYGYRLPYVEIEIRQDLIADAGGQRAWAARLAQLLPMACQHCQANDAQVIYAPVLHLATPGYPSSLHGNKGDNYCVGYVAEMWSRQHVGQLA